MIQILNTSSIRKKMLHLSHNKWGNNYGSIWLAFANMDKLMLSPYLLVIGLIKLPPSDAKVKVTFPKKPISLSYISSFRCHCQGAADTVCVSSMVTASVVHNTFFFIKFHLLNLYLPFRQHKHTTEDGISLRSFFKALFFD